MIRNKGDIYGTEPRKQKIIQRAIIALIIIDTLLALALLVTWGYRSPWTGFQGKTLWHWMQLLIVPAALAIGGFIFNRTEKQREQQRAEERVQREQRQAEEHARLERESTEDNQREAALQSYLDQMANLLQQGLRSSELGSELRDIARVRTLTTVRRLDPVRCTIMFRFLHDARLITNTPDSIVNLQEADLRNKNMEGVYVGPVYLACARLDGANLAGADLYQTNLAEAIMPDANLHRAELVATNLTAVILSQADLSEAQLTKAKLNGTILVKADLRDAVLNDANLSWANLQDATITQEQLVRCETLRGATLRDGTKVPDDQDFPAGWR